VKWSHLLSELASLNVSSTRRATDASRRVTCVSSNYPVQHDWIIFLYFLSFLINVRRSAGQGRARLISLVVHAGCVTWRRPALHCCPGVNYQVSAVPACWKIFISPECIYPVAKQTENNNNLTININSQHIQHDEVLYRKHVKLYRTKQFWLQSVIYNYLNLENAWHTALPVA